ncbi:hypothetical protein [Caballeronia sp. INDeC2]|uniref:hypothetical protein n=1 Tax=Caballeronia sp. INDeC2 TaxID=2921747 RepID=UPI00202854C9
MALSSIVIAAAVSFTSPSYSQNASPSGTDATQAAPTTKEQKKAARKQARMKKNAELKKLEDSGYNPGRANDPNYPANIQNAQKKAGVGAGASQ